MSGRYCEIMIAVLILNLVLGGCQAKDYKERIGLYDVSFKLPNEIASDTKLNITTQMGRKTLDGISYNLYSIEMNKSGYAGHARGVLAVYRYNTSHAWDPVAATEVAEAWGKSNGCTCNTTTRLIAGHKGVIVNCSACGIDNENYQFIYQLDDITEVRGLLYLDWNKVVVPLLNSLDVRYRKLEVM
jgi:hypothetical protein